MRVPNSMVGRRRMRSAAANMKALAARHSRSSALLRRGRVERGPLLFDFRAAAFWAFQLTLFMFRKSQDYRKFLAAGRTLVLVMRHGTFLSPRTIRDNHNCNRPID